MTSPKLSPATPQLASRDTDRTVAERVLRLAADGIGSLASQLDDAFFATLDLFQTVRGRVVVSGMGKSGHVARKIAATLASTGTPALFVHPAEASHGDMGMITTDDIVLALSNSGETAELGDLVVYTRRAGIPLVAMTRGADSSLGEAADLVLLLPALAEACPMGLAPTTSTTVMLALGDAIAVALLERRGFTAQDFQVLHPGGSLGRKLKRVSDLMHVGADLPLAASDVRVADAVLVMTAKRLGCVGITDDSGRLVGVVTDGDLRRAMSPRLFDSQVSEIMTAQPLTIRPQALAAEALGLMNARSVTVLFAVEHGKPVGALHIHDCLQAGVD
jgi:arabinose-5-phosphate isomerase